MIEEKAIERLNDLIHTCDAGIKEHGEYDDFFKEDKEAIKTVLNMLKEKDKEIEKKDRQIKEKTNRIRKLEKEAQGYFETTIIQSKQFSKKLDIEDKIIDLMAECIDVEISSARLGTILNKNVKPLETYKEDIKQYFKSKAEKE